MPAVLTAADSGKCMSQVRGLVLTTRFPTYVLCRCHYTGKLTSGAVFDSSYERRKPLTFKVMLYSTMAVPAAM